MRSALRKIWRGVQWTMLALRVTLWVVVAIFVVRWATIIFSLLFLDNRPGLALIMAAGPFLILGTLHTLTRGSLLFLFLPLVIEQRGADMGGRDDR